MEEDPDASDDEDVWPDNYDFDTVVFYSFASPGSSNKVDWDIERSLHLSM